MKDTALFPPQGDRRVPSRLFNASTGPISADMPCVAYECTPEFVLKRVSSNSFDLLGIRPEAITGTQALWRERLLEDDRLRLEARISRLGVSEVANETHRIKDDRGLSIWVAHSLQIARRGETAEIQGCILPLALEFQAGYIETSIISQFIHKIGNHFQLIDLLIGSFRRVESNLPEIVSLQNTVDRAVEFVRSFSNFCQPVSVHEKVELERVLKSVGICYGGKDTPVEMAIHPSLRGATLSGDAFLLESAFVAVLQNAFEASECGVPIAVKADVEHFVNGAPPMARISIRDLGHGIEAGAVSRIIEPFFSTRQDRNGLGLSSAVRIFELHGGGLKISSVKGQGTEVRVYLPVEIKCGQPSVRHV